MNPIRLIRRSEVERLTGLARSTIYARMEQGTFPRPVSLGGRSVAWRSDEINAWIEERINLSDLSNSDGVA
ncbi:MAG: helix-turn-helix transcriptional regulator [Pontibacterium sp.]